jgi:hypothetical protein
MAWLAHVFGRRGLLCSDLVCCLPIPPHPFVVLGVQDIKRQFSFTVEWSWHVIFGQPWADVEPDPMKLCPPPPGSGILKYPDWHVCGHGGG